MSLKAYRQSLNITLSQATIATGIPLRTYCRYESDEKYGDKLKRSAIYNALNDKFGISEEKGVLTIDSIKKIVAKVFAKYGDKVEFCYLFGSYARNEARENSDVDLCISTTLTGLKFVGLNEELRVALNKKIDLLRLSDMKDEIKLLNEIMKDGVKIYG